LSGVVCLGDECTKPFFERDRRSSATTLLDVAKRMGLPAVEELRSAREPARNRRWLRREILAWEGGGAVHHSTVEELNRLMADHPMRTRLKARGGASSTELWFEPNQPEDLLAPLAHSAATLFANVDRSRVRKCDQCVLHFHDTSKKGTRRWCSMQLCGNRLKVAAYAARRRMRARERQNDQVQD
jgi:predicted RNA-binding Zn ribbon-like protein